MRKTKYFIMVFIFLLFLNSCGYLEYAYEQAVLAYGGNPYKDPKPKLVRKAICFFTALLLTLYYSGYGKDMYFLRSGFQNLSAACLHSGSCGKDVVHQKHPF